MFSSALWHTSIMILSENMRAAFLIMASMTAFTINDAFMKLAAPGLPFFQQIFMRGMLIALGLTALAWLWGELRFRASQKDRKLIAFRTLAEAISTLLFLTALMQMPLANLSAILQALPLTVTLAAAVFLGEPVGWRRIVAILVGFVGVAIIIRPGMDGFTIYSLYVVGAVIFITFRDLSARTLSKDVPSSRVALSAAVGVTVLALMGSLFRGEAWIIPTIPQTLLLIGAAGCLMVGYICAVAGMRSGEVGFIAPFRYTSLIVALILGLVIFDEWPDALTMIGAAIVVATGLFTLYRERATARKATLGLRSR